MYLPSYQPTYPPTYLSASLPSRLPYHLPTSSHEGGETRMSAPSAMCGLGGRLHLAPRAPAAEAPYGRTMPRALWCP